MHKIESVINVAQVKTQLVIQSLGEYPTIGLKVDSKLPVKMVDGKFVEQEHLRTQNVSFVTDDGSPFELSGKVEEKMAVEMNAAHKVVLEVALNPVLTSAFNKGDRSKILSTLDVVSVVEVWATATKCVWKAADYAQATPGVAPKGTRTAEIGQDGKITQKVQA